MIKQIAISLACASFMAGSAQAVTTYTDSAAFSAAVTNATTSTFGSGTGSTYVGGTGVSGAGYTISGYYLFNNNPSYTTYYYDWGTGNVLTSGAGYTVTINFTTAVTAFSLDLSTFSGAGPNAAVYGYDVTVGTGQGDFAVTTLDRPNMAFFGATSDTGFTSITLNAGSSSVFFNFDNLTLATAIPAAAGVPEPASWAMMLGGFGLVGGAMRRRRAQVAFA
jgi:hypothetical protein